MLSLWFDLVLASGVNIGCVVGSCFRCTASMKLQNNQVSVLYLFNGTFEFVHVALKERKMGEEKVLEFAVFLFVGGQEEDDTYCYLFLPCNTKVWPTVLIRHVKAFLH